MKKLIMRMRSQVTRSVEKYILLVNRRRTRKFRIANHDMAVESGTVSVNGFGYVTFYLATLSPSPSLGHFGEVLSVTVCKIRL